MKFIPWIGPVTETPSRRDTHPGSLLARYYCPHAFTRNFTMNNGVLSNQFWKRIARHRKKHFDVIPNRDYSRVFDAQIQAATSSDVDHSCRVTVQPGRSCLCCERWAVPKFGDATASMLKRESLGDEAQRTAALGEHGPLELGQLHHWPSHLPTLWPMASSRVGASTGVSN